MNPWLIAASVLMLGLASCGVLIAWTRDLMEAMVGLQMATLVSVLVLMLLAWGVGRPGLIDLALVLAVISFPAGLLAARILEEWLP